MNDSKRDSTALDSKYLMARDRTTTLKLVKNREPYKDEAFESKSSKKTLSSKSKNAFLNVTEF